MFFTRKFKKLFSLLALLIWVHLDACTVYALVYQSPPQAPSVRLAPVATTQKSSGRKSLATVFLGGKFYPIPISSPGNEEATGLFDRDIATDYAPATPALVDVRFDSPQAISEIRIYGPSSYLLTVQEQINGQWANVDSCTDLDLSIQNEQWYSYPLGTAEEGNALRLQLVPIDNGGAAGDTGTVQGIREIEFWSPGQHEPVRSGMELHSLLDQGIVVDQSRQYQAEPISGVIGPEEGTYTDAARDNTFRFDLVYRPEQIKRAYLSYELSGLAHWTSAIRSINEQAAMGGYVIERGQGGQDGLQLEEIAPAWLRQGANQIRFVPVDGDSSYTVSKVQVLVELDDGTNSLNRVSTNMAGDRAGAASLYDGDTGTSLEPVQQQEVMLTGWEQQLWQVPSEESVEGATIELDFDRLTDLSAVGFYATGRLKGAISVMLENQGEWFASMASGEQDIKEAGWHYLNLPMGKMSGLPV